jgi:hypothetical protein
MTSNIRRNRRHDSCRQERLREADAMRRGRGCSAAAD